MVRLSVGVGVTLVVGSYGIRGLSFDRPQIRALGRACDVRGHGRRLNAENLCWPRLLAGFQALEIVTLSQHCGKSRITKSLVHLRPKS